MSSHPAITTLNYLNVAAYICNVLVTYAVGAAGLLDTPTNAELSEKYQTIVTPAGWAFSIWGIIFTMQLVWTIAQLTPAFRVAPLVHTGVSWYYIAVCAAQAAWTVTFTFEVISLSLVAMLSILCFLFLIVKEQYKIDGNLMDYWLLKFPFAIHFAWILAASTVNLSVVLVKLGVSADIQYYVALASLVIFLLATAYSLRLDRPEFVVPLVLAWACIAVFQELNDPKDLIVATFESQTISVVRSGAIIAATIMLAACVARGYTVFFNAQEPARDDTPASDPLLSKK